MVRLCPRSPRYRREEAPAGVPITPVGRDRTACRQQGCRQHPQAVAGRDLDLVGARPRRRRTMANINVVTIFYERGTDVVESVYSPHDAAGKAQQAKAAHAVRGTLTVHDKVFDTLERMDGYVRLDEGEYSCKLEESPNRKEKQKGYLEVSRKRRQIRPTHGKLNSRGASAAILIHSGTRPHHFEGCIGAGKRTASGITDSVRCMDELFAALGGFEAGKAVRLSVKGQVPATPRLG